MCIAAFSLLFAIFGAYGLIRGELPLVAKYKVTGTVARLTGIGLIVLALLVLVAGNAAAR